MKHIIELTKLAIQEKGKEIENLEESIQSLQEAVRDAQVLIGNLENELSELEAKELDKPQLAHPKEEYRGK